MTALIVDVVQAANFTGKIPALSEVCAKTREPGPIPRAEIVVNNSYSDLINAGKYSNETRTSVNSHCTPEYYSQLGPSNSRNTLEKTHVCKRINKLALFEATTINLSLQGKHLSN